MRGSRWPALRKRSRCRGNRKSRPLSSCRPERGEVAGGDSVERSLRVRKALLALPIESVRSIHCRKTTLAHAAATDILDSRLERQSDAAAGRSASDCVPGGLFPKSVLTEITETLRETKPLSTAKRFRKLNKKPAPAITRQKANAIRIPTKNRPSCSLPGCARSTQD